MNLRIFKSTADGKIKAPPSKSYAHRFLIGAALSGGVSKIEGISDSDDMNSTLNSIAALGVKFQKNGDTVSVFGGEFGKIFDTFNCFESGSTLRFFIPIALALGERATFVGTEKLISRGITVYEEIFKNQGIEIVKTNSSLTFNGKLSPDTFYMRGDISSQFITGMLFALPLLEGDSKIVITTELQSESYVNITLDAISKFGIKIERNGNEFSVKGNQKYVAANLVVEGDASNAAFLDGFNLLGGDVSVLGIENTTCQGDFIYKSYFEKIKNEAPTLDISDCPDLGPVCFALAALNNGAHFVGTKRLAIKESDRGATMACELAKLGGEVLLSENEITVSKISNIKENTVLLCHNDHRMAMSLALALSTVGGTLLGCECVKKSYPNFFEDIRHLGIKWEEIQ